MAGPHPPDDRFNLCSFLSGPYSTTNGDGDPVSDVMWVDCIQAHCMFWDSAALDCRFKLLGSKLTEMYNIELHKHNSHDHMKPHSASVVDSSKGAPMKKSGATATALIVEDSGGEDIDGNGFIYAKDFMIDPDDPDIPKMVATIKNPDFTGDLITWAEYLDSSSEYSIHVNEE